MNITLDTIAPQPLPVETIGEAKPFADSFSEFSSWLPESVRPMWEVIAHYPVVGSLAIVIIFYFAAFIVRNI